MKQSNHNWPLNHVSVSGWPRQVFRTIAPVALAFSILTLLPNVSAAFPEDHTPHKAATACKPCQRIANNINKKRQNFVAEAAKAKKVETSGKTGQRRRGNP